MSTNSSSQLGGEAKLLVTAKRKPIVLLGWVVSALVVAALAVGGFVFWQSLRSGITDEPIEEGMSRAEPLGELLMDRLQATGFTVDSGEVTYQGKGRCGGDTTSLGSSYATFEASSFGTTRLANATIVERAGVESLNGWRVTGDKTEYNPEWGTDSRTVQLTNGDLSLWLRAIGEPENKQPFVSLSISTDCYNYGVSQIDISDFGPKASVE